MSYAFEYGAYDLADEAPDSDGYRNTTKNMVTVTVKADDEVEAEKAAKAVVLREVFKLREVTELSEDLMPIKGD